MLVIDRNTVICGDCVDVLAALGEASVDAIVTDPPYGLGSREPTVDELVEFLRGERHIDTGGDFMGKQWQVPSVAAWKECWRVLKPGGHLLAFGGTRTFDLISLGLRAAGFEYRDTLQWLYGQGFPKSLDVSKAIDKEAGLERRVVGTKLGQPGYSLSDGVAGTSLSGSADGSLRDGRKECEVTEPASEEAKIWQGWGTALKPAWEPILMFRKPLTGTVAENVLEHGTGAINVDASRVALYEGKVTRAEATLDGRIENPTKKPVALMRWLVRLVCRKGGLVIDPYCGSGSTLVAALEEEMEFLGVDQDKVSVELARSRISVRRAQGVQTKLLR